MDISRFFDVDVVTYKDKGVIVYSFKDGLLDEFVADFVLPFRQAYISDQELDEWVANQVLVDREEGVKMLLPTKAYLKSGEFARLLLFWPALS